MAEKVKTKTKAAGKKVTDLSVEELKAVIKEIVRTELEEILGDPDAGLELREDFKESLRQSLASKEPTVSAEEAFAKVGLKW